jgi:protein TonB
MEKAVHAAPYPAEAQPIPRRPAVRAPILSAPAPVAISVPDLPARSVDLSFDRSRLGGASTLAPPVKPQAPAASDKEVALPVWVKQPSHKQMADADPPFASFMHVTGQVLLHCQIALDQRAHYCAAIREEPEGYRFGEAAIQVSVHFRIRPVVIGGVATPDAKVAIPVRFGN